MSERSLLMLPLANFMPPLPGLAGLAGSSKTYAPSPVWRDSTTDEVKFQPMPKKVAVKLYHRARDFERRTREPGKQDGALGLSAGPDPGRSRSAKALLRNTPRDFANPERQSPSVSGTDTGAADGGPGAGLLSRCELRLSTLT